MSSAFLVLRYRYSAQKFKKKKVLFIGKYLFLQVPPCIISLYQPSLQTLVSTLHSCSAAEKNCWPARLSCHQLSFSAVSSTTPLLLPPSHSLRDTLSPWGVKPALQPPQESGCCTADVSGKHPPHSDHIWATSGKQLPGANGYHMQGASGKWPPTNHRRVHSCLCLVQCWGLQSTLKPASPKDKSFPFTTFTPPKQPWAGAAVPWELWVAASPLATGLLWSPGQLQARITCLCSTDPLCMSD